MDLYNPFSDAVMQEPAVAYDYLHLHPVHLYADFDPPFYTLSRYADVSAALRDIERFSSEFGQGPRFTPPAGMLSNPPQHTFFRALVQQAFTPRAINAMAARVHQLAAELLTARTTEAWDLHDDFAFPLPVIVISEMLGVPPEDLHQFKHWSDASVAAMGSEDPSQYEDTLAELAAYLLDAIRQRRARDSGDDLITALVQARSEDNTGLADEEILSVVSQLLVGGNETTTSLITNAMWRMLQHPQLWQTLCNNPEAYVPIAVEESLRFDPPVLGLYRNTAVDVTLHGETIPAGSKVMLHYAAANRDPDVFADAANFRLDRKPQRHLAFGLGVHFCLGAQLARLEASACLHALANMCPDLQLAGDSSRITPFFLWGRRTLPVQG
ncbi:MAG: cytochrome P450 [Pseudomonadota bacterium]